MKKCFKCKRIKPRARFYKHPMMGDGHLGKCIACAKFDVRKNRALRRPQYAAYDAARGQTSERKAQKLEHDKRHRAKNPIKARARNAVSNAVRDGRLIKTPCVHCGATENIHGHHGDYSKPLDVVWCCPRCHCEKEHGKVWTPPEARVRTKGSRWDKRRNAHTYPTPTRAHPREEPEDAK